MKPIRVLLSLLIVGAVLFASATFVNAIGFEAEQVYESVFVIYSGNSLGSGFAIGENCIITNAHVVENSRSITVSTYGGEEYAARVLGMDQNMDIAVLVVADAKFPYLPVADVATMKTGDDIYAIGAPKGMAYTLTKGSISAKERTVGDQTYIQIDAPINQGNSGGPLMNDGGQVLGMNTLKMNNTEGIGLAIPIGRVCDYLTSLGVTLNSEGNVAQPIPAEQEAKPVETQPAQTQPAQTQPYTDPEIPNQSDTPDNSEVLKEKDAQLRSAKKWGSIAVIVAVVSLVANGVLAVLWMNEKKKCASLLYDPSERTDFDIEILE